MSMQKAGRKTSELKVASVQIAIESGKDGTEGNINKCLDRIAEAARNRARLIVLPECCNSGNYFHSSREEAYERATRIPGSITNRIGLVAKENEVYVAIGLTERGVYPKVYSTIVLFDPTGKIIGRYRKHFLISHNKLYYELSETGFPIIETEIGTIGFCICAEARIPEIVHLQAIKGANIICNCSNWGSRDQFTHHMPARTIENMVWSINADRIGKEMGICWLGHSFIMHPQGNLLAEAGEDTEEIIYAKIQPEEAIDKRVGPRNDLFADRRPETYFDMIASIENMPLAKVNKATQFTYEVFAIELPAKMPNTSLIEEAIMWIEYSAQEFDSKLIVLPELFDMNLPFDPKEAQTLAESVPGSLTEKLCKCADKRNIYVAGSVIEKESGVFYNTAFLIGPDGLVGKYRKMHLWDAEKFLLTPGNLGYPVFDTCEENIGRIGIMVGYDMMFPEVGRILTSQGADVIVMPTAFANPTWAQFVTQERAMENRVFIVAASRSGDKYIGCTQIVDINGRVLAKTGIPPSTDRVATAWITASLAREKRIAPRTDVIRTRWRSDWLPWLDLYKLARTR